MGADRYYKYFKEEEMNEIIKQTGFEVCDFHKEGGVNNNKSVSYTHLDVYKRQIYKRPRKGRCTGR